MKYGIKCGRLRAFGGNKDYIKKKKRKRNFHGGSAETNLTSIHENTDLIPGLTQWVNDLVLL